MLFRCTVLSLISLVFVLQLRDEARSRYNTYLLSSIENSQRVAQSRSEGDFDIRIVDIDRLELLRMLEAPTSPGAARIIPAASGSGKHHVAIHAVSRGSLFESLGFQAGDLLISTNGEDALNGPTADTLVAPASDPDFLDLELERRGRRVRIIVLIHG